MAGKSRKRKKRRSTDDLFQQAQNSLAKGKFKQAYKNAKVCWRRQPSEEHRGLYERACLARAGELECLGCRAEAKSVIEMLLQLGVTQPAVRDELPPLLVAVGMSDRWLGEEGGSGAPLTDDTSLLPLVVDHALLPLVVDHAVLRPDEAPASQPIVRRQALKIRAALSALEQGNEADVGNQLRDIARNSPFADWKLFVRGLAAYYQHDTAAMDGNWSRLDRQRFAARIAASLKSLADPSVAGKPVSGKSAGNRILRVDIPGSTVLARLRRIRELAVNQRWQKALDTLRRSRRIFVEFDADLPQRIAIALHANMVGKGQGRYLTELTRMADPPSMDPRWNRAWAIVWEHPDNDDVDQAEAYWRAYLDDLAELPQLSQPERERAGALVWRRLGRNLVEEAEAVSNPFFDDDDDEVTELQSRAIRSFSESLQADPTLLPAYQDLAAFQLSCGKDEEAAATQQRLLEHHPENLDALLFLARHYRSQDDPFTAREYASRARALKPSNEEIVQLQWWVHVASARRYGVENQWDKARAEFDAAEKVDSSTREAPYLLAKRAILELKARNFDLGEQLIEKAKACYQEPTPALLILAVESIRYAMTKTAQHGFHRGWKGALKKKCQSETAGRMCQLMTAYCEPAVDYPGRSGDIDAILAYVRRSSRVKWQVADLRDTCEFLQVIISDLKYAGACDLLEKLAKKGNKKFPDCALFPLIVGKQEVDKGPVRCRRRHAQKCFQRALKLAQASGDPRDAEIVEKAKRWLTFLGEIGLDRRPPPRLPPPADFAGFEPDDPFLKVIPPELMAILSRMCREMGLPPDEVAEKLMEMGPDKFLEELGIGAAPGGQGDENRRQDERRREKRSRSTRRG